ncbi:transposase [Nonomuraea sp. GTA35]|uniref:transposase n=1 Tax=Nonomuraea sp. GTA35 TaxID=1676746 RepID=UPI0035BF5A68
MTRWREGGTSALLSKRPVSAEKLSARPWARLEIVATRQQVGAPLVWCWDTLNVHLAGQWADFAAEHADWLRIVRLPAYAPELNPAEGVWSLLRRSLANFAVTDLPGLTRIIKRKLVPGAQGVRVRPVDEVAEEDPVPAPLAHRLPDPDTPQPRYPDTTSGMLSGRRRRRRGASRRRGCPRGQPGRGLRER